MSEGVAAYAEQGQPVRGPHGAALSVGLTPAVPPASGPRIAGVVILSGRLAWG
jgi:hypothetical protein